MKKLAVVLGVVFSAIASQAEYLWWTVDNSSDAVGNYLDALKEGKKISSYADVYAKIVAKDSDGNVKGQWAQGYAYEWGTGNGQQGVAVDMHDLLGSNYSGAQNYSYYVEICSSVSGYDKIGYNTGAQTYSAMQTAGSITTDNLTPVAAAQVWHGGSGAYKAAPEPTSAMLMLLGVAGLALRRKQRKIA